MRLPQNIIIHVVYTRDRRGPPANGPGRAHFLELGGYRRVVLPVLADERVDGKRPHVELVKPGLHRGDIYLVRV